MSVNSNYSHTKEGLFYFDLPVTIALSILFHQIVKKNLISNVPYFFQKRFSDTLQLNFIKYLKKNWWIFLLSALLGAASHIVWDSFTHNNRFFARQFSEIYRSTSFPFMGANYPLFYVLQQVSTVVGLTAVTLYVLLKKPFPTAALTSPRIAYWLVVLCISIVVIKVRFYIYPDDYDLGNTVVTSISGLLIGVVCCGFINFKNTIHYQGSLNG
jgi:hypothetical protein